MSCRAEVRGERMARPVELYTAHGCQYSAAAREDLEWRGIEFVEYDVEGDPEARKRMLELTGGTRTAPVIVEEGKPVQVGWMGRGCTV
jgi:glutaredoxin 3